MAQSKKPKKKLNAAFALVLGALIIGMVVAAAGFIFFTPDTGETSMAKEAASSTIEEAFNPSDEKRAQVVEGFEEAIASSSGISFSKLGISSEEFASWLFDSTEHEITGARIDTVDGLETATVDVRVTTHSLSDMEASIATLSSSLDSNAFAQANNEAELYRMVGDVVKQAMEETPLSTKQIQLMVVNKNGTWQVDKAEAANFINKAFTSS